MKHLLLFDTSIGTDNVGDEIIMDFCHKRLLDMFQDKLFYTDRVPTHLEIGNKAYELNKNAALSIVCGTNILKTSILRKRNWKIGIREAFNIDDLCLMGAGWGNYNAFSTDPYTKFIYKSLLSKTWIHSVRDEYTKAKLNAIGVKNVLNTACPTMWRLTPEHCEQIPIWKSKEVVTALTYYKPDAEKDRMMLDILGRHYKKIYLWLQQEEDYAYYLSLNSRTNVEIINPQLALYDKVLQEHEVDFVGSRLHGGIRALNHKRRSLIVGVDNRAREINRDTNLPFISREKIERLESWITGETPTEINLPQENIRKWKSQFDNLMEQPAPPM